MQAIGSARIAIKSQVEFGIAFVVSGAFGQLIRIAFLGAQRIVETMIGVAAKCRVRGLQGERGFHAPVGGRCAKQILHVHLGFQFVRRYPALGDFRGEFCDHLHAIRQKFLHTHRDAAELRVRQTILHGEKRDGVIAGG